MSERSEYYMELSLRDVRQAYQEVRNELVRSREALGKFSKGNLLLRLVQVNIDRDEIRFSSDFADKISELTKISRKNLGNVYSGLGVYLDLIDEEMTKISPDRLN